MSMARSAPWVGYSAAAKTEDHWAGDEMGGGFQGKRILITGGLGFIGSNLARRLVDQGAEVLLLDSLVPEYGGNPFNIAGVEGKVRVNISDVRDTFSMSYLIQDRDYLLNLA